MDFPKRLGVLLASGAVVVACGGRTIEPSTESASTPASEQAAGETPASSDARGSDRASSPAPAESAAPDPCAGLECPEGYCDLKSVQCVRAPCHPVPTCVAGTHPCAATTCATNTRCESHDGEAVCVPLTGGGAACGRVTCAVDQVCCNESCGICTPVDGVCTQQLCE